MSKELQKGEDLGECPVCKKGRLIVRENRKKGNLFIGCSRWPACNHTQSAEDYHKPGDFSWLQT